MKTTDFIIPQWPAPDNIHCAITTRDGGVSLEPFSSFNLATHVNDDTSNVLNNRKLLSQKLKLPSEPVWLNQVHSNVVVNAADNNLNINADASFSDKANIVSIVMTADCLPVLFTNLEGTVIAAAHAGWRGLLNGILENTLAKMAVAPEKIIAYLGPAIGPNSFEVGEEVKQQFTAENSQTKSAFIKCKDNKFLADIYQIARLRLYSAGIKNIYGGGLDTMTDPRFYSYRKQSITGRMASLIWFT